MAAADGIPQSGAQEYTSTEPIRIWGMSGSQAFNLTFVLIPVSMGVIALIAGALEKNGTAPFVTGIILCAITVPIALLVLPMGLRPIVISEGCLHIPKPFRSINIPLSHVAGVGLIYRYTPGSRTPYGWQLRVWDGEQVHQIAKWIVVEWIVPRVPGKKRPLIGKRDWSLPLAHEDVHDLAATREGQVARRIYDAALAWQGQYGPLVRDARQKHVAYDPNASTHLAAWWSPDGTMGRAKGFVPLNASYNHLASRTWKPMPEVPKRRTRSVLAAVLGTVGAVLLATAESAIGGASTAHHPTSGQQIILDVAYAILLGGMLLSLFWAVRIWRRPKRLAKLQHDAVEASTWGHPSATPPQPSAVQEPMTLPPARPEVISARRRNVRLTLAGLPFAVAFGLITPLLLGHVGHLPSGETCNAVLGPPSTHPSAACNAWRHHQLMIFLYPAVALGLGMIAMFVVQVRSFRRLERLSKEPLIAA